MSDLINRDKVLELFSEMKYQIAPHCGGYKYMSDEQKEQYNTIEGIENKISNIPTVDAVEVVRCGECEYCDYSGCKNKTVYCLKNECFMQEDCYCSYGKRRESEVSE